MESSSQNSKKRMLSETATTSRSTDDDDDVVLIPPPVTPARKQRKGKEAIAPDVIVIDDDGDSNIPMFLAKQRLHRSFERMMATKMTKYSSYDYLDHQAQEPVANNVVSYGKSASSASHKVAFGDLLLDEVIDVDEYARLQSHFDNMDIPPGVEAPMPPIPRLLDPPISKPAVSGSSSFDTKYKPAKSTASASHTVINKEGPSNSAFTGLYLDEFIDIDEYAQMTAYFDELDVPPTIDALSPLGLSSDFRGSAKAVSGSSSSLKNQIDSFRHSLGISSCGNSPQVSSRERKQSYLQHLCSASSLSVEAESSKLQIQTQNDVSMEQVSSMNKDKTMGKVDSFKQFDTVEDHSDHHYTKASQLTKQKNWAKKIQDEWRILEKDLPDMISVRVYETRMDLLRAVIVGAEGTPYHDGLFFFDVSFPSSYPNKPPLVYYHSGGLRLNPNLYNCGKVCLSLLNTWSGGKEEKWIPGRSTMLQVLVSIQGLILNADPYFNEPSRARMKYHGDPSSKAYNENTFILSLKTMVYIMRKPPKHFEELVLGHFRNRAHAILGACKAYMDGAEVGCLVEGQLQVQSVNGNKAYNYYSKVFKNSLAGFLPTLVNQFKEIGVKDCEKFLPPATVGNKPNGTMHQAASPTFPIWSMKPTVPWSIDEKLQLLISSGYL